MKIQKNTIKILGFILLILSILSWIMIALISFFPLEIKTKGIMATTIFALGEAAFVGSIALLGKEYWEQIKQYFWRFFGRKKEKNSNNTENEYQKISNFLKKSTNALL